MAAVERHPVGQRLPAVGRGPAGRSGGRLTAEARRGRHSGEPRRTPEKAPAPLVPRRGTFVAGLITSHRPAHPDCVVRKPRALPNLSAMLVFHDATAGSNTVPAADITPWPRDGRPNGAAGALPARQGPGALLASAL
ncbi:hypothetical protein San01_05490 [Streptomyces angustmyceticus]|uniref:Uncharacterized protein n=1 Tax=Streptomyces angustmyceticus TaxID=285578 RepID=A0A5J4L7A3_9ACTN|nr:hypothetical protein San01_05490 [Streptomyces angustmyceticus]